MTSRIVVFTEKHGDRYFDASTVESTARNFLKVLKGRVADGYWYYREYEAPERKLNSDEAAYVALTDEQLAALPEATRNELSAKRARLIKAQEAYLRNKKMEDEWFNAVDYLLSLPEDEAIKVTRDDPKIEGRWGSGPMVQQVLGARNDYQYEGFNFHTLES